MMSEVQTHGRTDTRTHGRTDALTDVEEVDRKRARWSIMGGGLVYGCAVVGNPVVIDTRRYDDDHNCTHYAARTRWHAPTYQNDM